MLSMYLNLATYGSVLFTERYDRRHVAKGLSAWVTDTPRPCDQYTKLSISKPFFFACRLLAATRKGVCTGGYPAGASKNFQSRTPMDGRN